MDTENTICIRIHFMWQSIFNWRFLDFIRYRNWSKTPSIINRQMAVNASLARKRFHRMSSNMASARKTTLDVYENPSRCGVCWISSVVFGAQPPTLCEGD